MKKILLVFLILFLTSCALRKQNSQDLLSESNEIVDSGAIILVVSDNQASREDDHRSIVSIYENGQKSEFIKNFVTNVHKRYEKEKLVLVTLVALNPFVVKHFVLNHEDNVLVEISITPQTEQEFYGAAQVLYPLEYVVDFFVEGKKNSAKEFFVLDQLEFRLSKDKLFTILNRLSNGKLFKDN